MKPLRLFLDTADMEKLKLAVSTGIVDGIATNPEKVAASGRSYEEVVKEIRGFFNGPVAVQAMGRNREEIVAHAQLLNAIDDNLAIKVTCTVEGIAAISELVPRGVLTNCTLIYSASQGFAAGLAGSPFISPFIGRSEMAGHDGIEMIGKIRKIYDQYNLNSSIIAASVKSVKQVVDSVIAGADAVAVTWPVFEAMINHPLTDKGYEQFLGYFESIAQPVPDH